MVTITFLREGIGKGGGNRVPDIGGRSSLEKAFEISLVLLFGCVNFEKIDSQWV